MGKFNVQCSLPPDVTTFVSSPDARGTLDIVWSCLGIMLICTWSILHPNVPFQTIPRRKKHKYTRAIFRIRKKLIWMLFNILAPEWSLGKAWADYQAVRTVEAEFDALKDETQDDVEWTRTHTYLANMGGITILFDDSMISQSQHDSHAPTKETSEHEESREQEEASAADQRDPVKSETRIDTPEESVMEATAVEPAGTSVVREVEPSEKGLKADAGSRRPSLRPPETSPVTVLDPEQAVGDMPASIERILHKAEARSAEREVFATYGRDRRSRKIGDMQWDVNTQNFNSVSKAALSVSMADFEDFWEKTRFASAYRHWYANLKALQRDRWILDASQLLLARRYGIIDRLPDMREDDISDRNKGDLFVKAIAIGQTLWFVLQLIVRITWRLPTSQLEIMTLAFALCTAMAYLLLLDKPKDVQYSVVIHAKRYATPKQLIRLALLGPTTYGLYRGGINIPNNAIHVVRTRSGAAFHWPLFVGASFSIFIFGALHCVAWEFAFPNKIEQWLWQASSVVTAASIPCAWVFRRVAKIIRQNLLGNKKSAMYFRSPASILSGNIIAATFGLLFILSRVIILVEVFRSLAFLPPRAFETTWANAIPHFG